MSKRILVIEDQPDNRQIIRDMLAPTDYEIIEAENGEQALAVIAKERPDLILMDIQLPVMDGYEATRRINRLPDADWWLTNGGAATLISYGQQAGEQADVTIVPASHLDWIERLPLMYVDEHRIFVHAGVDPNCSLDEQDAENAMWKIYRDDDDGGHGQRHVIHGHHAHAHGPIFKKNRTNTFAWYSGRLAIGVFDDAVPGGPIEVLEVHGEPFENILSSRRSMALKPEIGRAHV